VRDFNKIEMQAVIKFLFLQGKAPKEIRAILTETLACFLPGRAKDFSAPLYCVHRSQPLLLIPGHINPPTPCMSIITVSATWCLMSLHQSHNSEMDLSMGRPLYLRIQYPWFQLSAVYHGPKKIWKIREINGS